MSQLVILRDRYNENYQVHYGIATDPKVKSYDKVQTLAAMKGLSDTIMRLYRDATGLSIVQRRKLQGLEKGTLYFDNMRARLPPVFEWAPLPPPPLPPAQQHQDDDCDDEGGDMEEEERADN